MNGKGPIIGVLGLGLVASLCAAVLMAAMRSGGGDAVEVPTETEVVVVARDLPAMTRIEREHLEILTVAIGEEPEGSFSDPVQILGRVVKIPLVAGQPIATDLLLGEEGGAQLASSLPPGMRAVSVELPGSSAMRGLLYPGCRVDVIVAFRRAPGGRASTGPMSRTLLQNVAVLAVEDKTVFTAERSAEEDEEERAAPARRGANRTLMVTLMVDPQQARELQASGDIGELSLSLRNPLDESMTDDPMAQGPEAVGAPEGGFAAGVGPVARPSGAEGPDVPWRTLVIRSDKTEVRTFNEPGKAPEEDDPDERLADVPVDPEIDE
jgi:pilus assembly protein CpaB